MKMKRIVALAVALGVMTMGLFHLFGCKNIDAVDIPESQPVDGGEVDNSYDAPKKFQSENIVSFRTHFFRFCSNGHAGGGSFFTFDVRKDDDGRTVLSETEEFGVECTADEGIFREIYDILDEYSLFRYNGTDCITSGLPPEAQPCTMEAEFDSGEKLYFRMDGYAYAEWSCEMSWIFADAFSRAGDDRIREAIFARRIKPGDREIERIVFHETTGAAAPWYCIELLSDEAYFFVSENEEITKIAAWYTPGAEDVTTLFDGLTGLGVLDWNGFARFRYRDREGGTSFDFRIVFDAGTDAVATGLNVFPEHYDEAKTMILDMLRKLEQQAAQ